MNSKSLITIVSPASMTTNTAILAGMNTTHSSILESTCSIKQITMASRTKDTINIRIENPNFLEELPLDINHK